VNRWFLKLGFVVSLGAIINVAVAWACSVWIDPGTQGHAAGFSSLVGPQWSVAMQRRAGAAAVLAKPLWWDQYHDSSKLLTTPIPSWSKAATPPESRDHYRLDPNLKFICCEGANGWPQLSLLWRVETNNLNFETQLDSTPPQWGIEIAPDLTRAPVYQQRRVLPLCPIWPGFAVNTLFYAAIAWILFTVPAYLKRRHRIRRGLCAKCAYPVGESENCTECGAAIIGRRDRHPEAHGKE
jgi:hypothetical protein